jgi:hypothetical protein
MEAPQRQQSATISQMRIDIGARQSGHPQKIDPPESQISPLPRLLAPRAGRALGLAGSGAVNWRAAGRASKSGNGPSDSRSNTGNRSGG